MKKPLHWALLAILVVDAGLLVKPMSRWYRMHRDNGRTLRLYGPGTVQFVRVKTDHGWKWFKATMR